MDADDKLTCKVREIRGLTERKVKIVIKPSSSGTTAIIVQLPVEIIVGQLKLIRDTSSAAQRQLDAFEV